MQEERLWVGRGSGSTGCLLNALMQDEREFVGWDSGVGVVQLQLAGMFALGVDAKGDLYLWGSCSNRLISKPQLLMKNVARFACGW